MLRYDATCMHPLKNCVVAEAFRITAPVHTKYRLETVLYFFSSVSSPLSSTPRLLPVGISGGQQGGEHNDPGGHGRGHEGRRDL